MRIVRCILPPCERKPGPYLTVYVPGNSFSVGPRFKPKTRARQWGVSGRLPGRRVFVFLVA